MSTDTNLGENPGIDSMLLLESLQRALPQLAEMSKRAAIGAAELQGGPPPGGDPAAMGAMPPGGDPAMMGGAMPPGADPSMMGAMPPGADPSMGGAMPPGGDPAAAAAPPDPLSEALMQIADGQTQMMQKMDQLLQVFGFMLDQLGLKVNASEIIRGGGTLGGAPKKAGLTEIKDGFVDDDEPAMPAVVSAPAPVQKVNDFYHRHEDGGDSVKVAAASAPRTSLNLGETGGVGAGGALALKPRTIAAPARNRAAAQAIRIRRGR